MTDDARPTPLAPSRETSRGTGQPLRLRVVNDATSAGALPAAISSAVLSGERTSKKVKIVSLGCVENALTAARYQGLLELEQWQLVDATSEADLVVVNTCGVSQEQADDSLRVIEDLRRCLRKDGRLVVTGCLVNIDRATLDKVAEAGAEVVSPRDPARFEALIGSAHRLEDVRPNAVSTHFLRTRLRALNLVGKLVALLARVGLPYPERVARVLSAFEQAGWHFVQVSTGCVHACRYCAIRFAKGWIKSESRESIRAQVASGVAEGQDRIVLVADDTGSYGLDNGSDIGELLLDLVGLPGNFGIHVRNLEPMGMLRAMDRLKQAVGTGKIRAITVPLQSGSDAILESMGREYRLAPVVQALAELKSLCPEMLILTHILVGFPGETREDFRATLEMIRCFEFDGVAPDCFSPRKNTAAVHIKGHLPWLVRRWRYYLAMAYIIWRVYLRSCLTVRWRRGPGLPAVAGPG